MSNPQKRSASIPTGKELLEFAALAKETLAAKANDPMAVYEYCPICNNYIELLQAVILESGEIICQGCNGTVNA